MKVVQSQIKGDFLEIVCLFNEDNGWSKLLEEAKTQLAAKLKVKGFREGKVPVELLNQHIKNNELLDKATQLAQEKAFKTLLKERETTLLNKYRLFEAKTEKISFSECQLLLKWQKLPTLKLMKWNNFKCDLQPITVSQQEVNEKLEQLRGYFATFEEVNKPLIEAKDYVLLNHEGKCAGKVEATLTTKESNYQVGHNKFGSDFDQALIGLAKGAKKNFSINFAKDYFNSQLAGKTVEFSVEILKIQHQKLPPVTDLVGLLKMDKIKTFIDLEQLITTSIKKSKIEQMRQQIISLIWPKLLKESTVDIPKMYLEAELLAMKQRHLEDLKVQKKTLSQFLEERKINEQQFDDELKTKVKKTLTDYLLINEVAQATKITVSEKEIEDYYQFLSKNQNKKIEEVKALYSKPLLFNNLLRFRVEDFLIQDTLQFNNVLSDNNPTTSKN